MVIYGRAVQIKTLEIVGRKVDLVCEIWVLRGAVFGNISKFLVYITKLSSTGEEEEIVAKSIARLIIYPYKQKFEACKKKTNCRFWSLKVHPGKSRPAEMLGKRILLSPGPGS